MCAALLVLTVGGSHVGAAIIARHRAQAAADLAALAAADALPAGPERACARAMVVAVAMSTEVVACDVDGLDVLITVAAIPGIRLAPTAPARAIARAGPADPPP